MNQRLPRRTIRHIKDMPIRLSRDNSILKLVLGRSQNLDLSLFFFIMWMTLTRNSTWNSAKAKIVSKFLLSLEDIFFTLHIFNISIYLTYSWGNDIDRFVNSSNVIRALLLEVFFFFRLFLSNLLIVKYEKYLLFIMPSL